MQNNEILIDQNSLLVFCNSPLGQSKAARHVMQYSIAVIDHVPQKSKCCDATSFFVLYTLTLKGFAKAKLTPFRPFPFQPIELQVWGRRHIRNVSHQGFG